MRTIIFTITILALMASCRSVDKMIVDGNFDAALAKAVKKVRGKRNIKTKYVLAIAEAFNKATERDMDIVQKNYDSDFADDVHLAIVTLERIENRQETIERLLPLVSNEGIKAKFAFVKTKELYDNSVTRFIDLTYQEVIRFLADAKEGDKIAGRSAYDQIDRIRRYRSHYKNIDALQKEAQELGVTHVSVQLVNNSYEYISPRLARDIYRSNFRDDRWVKYHFEEGMAFADYEIDIIIDELEISPERINEKRLVEKREIEDGWEYVLDENGNVAKDSLGNDIKKSVIKKVKAHVVKAHQLKKAFVRGRIVTTDVFSGERDHFGFHQDLIFEHFYGTFRGDKRALSKSSLDLVGIAPLPFPSDRQMIHDLIGEIDPAIRKAMRKSRFHDLLV